MSPLGRCHEQVAARGGETQKEDVELVLGAYVNAFRTPDLRKKLLFVLFIIVIFRLGSQIPAPGVNVANVHECIKGASGSLTNLINLFSGGALLQLTIFALGIMPYITASIILQLLVVVIPRLEALKKEGQAGQTKICLLYTSPSPRDGLLSRMPSSA